MKTISISKSAAVVISKSGKIMFKDGDVLIRTNLTSLPDYIGGLSYDPTKVEEYNGGKYVNGELTLGINPLYQDKIAFLKEAGIALSI